MPARGGGDAALFQIGLGKIKPAQILATQIELGRRRPDKVRAWVESCRNVSVGNVGLGGLVRADHLRAAATRRNAQFVSLHDSPEAISLCIDPDTGKTSLAELALPPTPRENYLCQLGTVTAAVEAEKLQAELRVSLDVESLYLGDEIAPLVSPSKRKQIEAIVSVAAKRTITAWDTSGISLRCQCRRRD